MDNSGQDGEHGDISPGIDNTIRASSVGCPLQEENKKQCPDYTINLMIPMAYFNIAWVRDHTTQRS